MNKILTFLVVVALAVVVAYLAGYWPQRQRLATLEAEKAALQQRADAAEARVRAGQLLGELLALKETVQEMNYGQARALSSPFFDHVRAEAPRTTDPAIKQALDSIQALRDPMTVALTQGDASALTHLREAERRLRIALGYAAPVAAAPPLPLPAPSLVPTPGVPGALPTPSPLAPGSLTPSPNPLGAPLATPTPQPNPMP